MWWTNCISVLVVSVVLQTSATPTDTFSAQTDTAVHPTDAIGTLPVQPPIQSTQEPLPVNANLRSGLPIRTGGKPLPIALPTISQDDNYINENTDLSNADIPNILFVPIFSQNYYFPERSYPPSMRNFFVGDRSPYGVVQYPNRRNVENALYDSYFSRQNQNQEAGTLAFGTGQNFADRFTAFREWILNLFPFRLEFNRPATQVPRPLLNAMPENNIPHPENHHPTSVHNIPSRVHYIIPSNVPSTTNDKLESFSTPVNNLPGTFPSTVNDLPSNFNALTNNIRNSIGQNNIPSNFPTAVNKVPTNAQIIPIRSDNIQTTTSQLPIGVYRQKYTPYDPLNRGLYNLPQRQYLQPNVDLTNRNYQPMINNFRDINNGQPYAYRQYSPHNVYPYAQTSSVLKGFHPYYSNE